VRRPAPTFEFEASLGPEGNISVPAGLMKRISPGRVHVRLTDRGIAHRLRRNGVTQDEIDRIAARQKESREQVIAFLLVEGSSAKIGRRPRRNGAGRGRR
jgi:hypothetical protein